MIRKAYYLIATLLLSSLVASCHNFAGEYGLFAHHDSEYLNARHGHRMRIPGDIDAHPLAKDNRIPIIEGKAPADTYPPGFEQHTKMAKRKTKKILSLAHGNIELLASHGDVDLWVHSKLNDTWLAMGDGLQRQQIPIEKLNEKTHTIAIRDTYLTSNKLTQQTPTYLMHFQGANQWVRVYLTDPQKHALKPANAKRILATVAQSMVGDARIFVGNAPKTKIARHKKSKTTAKG